MSQKHLINSIALTETSSGGLYDPVGLYGLPSSLARYRTENCLAMDVVSAAFSTTITHAGHELALFSHDRGEAAFKRTLACLLLWTTPEEGLDEAVDSLAEIRAHFLMLGSKSVVPKIAAIEGRIGQTHDRPKLEVGAE